MTRLTPLAGLLTLSLAGCGQGAASDQADGSGGQANGDGGSNASGGAAPTGGSSSGGTFGGQGGDGSGDGSGGSAPQGPSTECGETIEPSANQIKVGPEDDLADALANAPAGSTVLLADGTYNVGPDGLWIGADNVIVRSASGDPASVILDGGYRQTSGGVLNVAGRSDVTLAHLTITRGRYHLVHVTGGPEGPSAGARLYDLELVDPGEQAVKVNSNYDFDSDDGEIACSTIQLTDEGRGIVMQNEAAGSFCYTGGIDAHRAQSWTVRDNVIEGFWCDGDLSEHGIHFWRGSRDTVIQRNLLIDNARGIGLGLGQPGSGRTYDDAPCGGQAAEHYGGTIENNMIVGRRPELFASPSGMDLGVGLEAACEVLVVHNTVASIEAPFSSMEWRWPETSVRAVNNLVTHELRTRDDATAELVANVTNAPLSTFLDLEAADAHLASASVATAGASEGAELAPLDFDGDARTATPHVGADQAVE
jgi:hypothetical protein